jgi:hypothetical protein
MKYGWQYRGFLWKYRASLWKYRNVIRHRKAIAGSAAAVGAAGLAAWYFLRGTSARPVASNG